MEKMLSFFDLLFNHPTSSIESYADSYRQAANILAQKVLTAKGCNDYNIIPTIFLYRHTIELYLKTFILEKIKIICSIRNLYSINISETKLSEIKNIIFTSHKISLLKEQLLEVSKIIKQITDGDINLKNILNEV